MIVFQGKVGTVYKAVLEDVEFVGLNMRQSDVAELHDGVGAAPIPALIHALKASSKCWTIKMGDIPVAMFGVAPDPEVRGLGLAWYLATDIWDREGRRDMLTNSPRFIDMMQDGYEVIANFLDCRNPRSIKWLKSLGFSVGQTWSGTASGLPFVFMYRVAPDV